MAELNSIDQYLESHLDESLQELVRLCAQPSVSAQNWGLVECADLVAEHPMQIVPMSGGSGPNYAIAHYLNLPIASSGVGYPGGQSHAPNENLRPDLYLKGARHVTRILKAFGSN